MDLCNFKAFFQTCFNNCKTKTRNSKKIRHVFAIQGYASMDTDLANKAFILQSSVGWLHIDGIHVNDFFLPIHFNCLSESDACK
jgi:hypothetical protein